MAGDPASAVKSSVQIDSGPASAVSDSLYVGNGDQTITLPLSALGGTVPSDLAISASNLPSGISVTLTGVKQEGDQAVLSVSTQRVDTEAKTGVIDALANVSVISDDTILTMFQVPVESADMNTTPRLNAVDDH